MGENGLARLQSNYDRNAPYVAPGSTGVRTSPQGFRTDLAPLDEMTFRDWVAQNGVPFNPNAAGPSDYDMRGFYQGLQQKNPRAVSAVNPNDNRMHYTDTYKTPYHDSFSAGSQWAGQTAPMWTEDDKLVSPGARILFDERRGLQNLGKPGAY